MLDSHWAFYMLPPFFTLQPVPGTLCKQQKLWADVVLDHAAWATTLTPESDGISSCEVLRLYTPDCALFHNPSLGLRMATSSAAAMLEGVANAHPNQCALVEGSTPSSSSSLLVSCVSGGLAAVEHSLLSWLLEEGGGTTTNDLAKNGVVMTFDELIDAKCLYYKSTPKLQRQSGGQDLPPILTADPASRYVGSVSDEVALRSLIVALQGRAVSLLRPFKITQFNLDGSSTQPFEGIKFGGQ